MEKFNTDGGEKEEEALQIVRLSLFLKAKQ